MGCQSSQIQKSLGIRINILDSTFVKKQNHKIKQKMNQLDIKYQVYLSLSCLIQDMTKIYTNQIICTEQYLMNLKRQLRKQNFHPNIYVVSGRQKNQEKVQDKLENEAKSPFQIKYYKNYDKIIQSLSQKTLKKRFSCINPAYQKDGKKIGVKIFRKSQTKSSEEIIFEQTLKSKNISYEIYKTFNNFQASLPTSQSNFIVTDYVYHRQVINLVQKTNAKVICYCDMQKDQIYDPKTYFVTNNFLQIVSEVQSQSKLCKLNMIKCSKAFIYANQQSYLCNYGQILQNFDFQIKIYDSLIKIMNQCKYYFAVTIIIDPQIRKQVEKYLQKNDYTYKTKIVQIKKGTQISVKGLRKTIKQLKKGYRAEKGLTKSIDIIDKHFDNVKFESIKKQLQKYSIKCYGYNSLNDYIKTKKLVSSFIISNYEQKSLIIRYLKQIQSKSKIILFCNKNLINNQLKQNKSYAYVSCHFGKILNFIKKHTVYNPYILDQNDCRITEKKQKLKKQNKRISALKWCGVNSSFATGQNQLEISNLQKQFQFLNVNKKNLCQIKQIQKQCSVLLKLDYSPLNKPLQFKKYLLESFRNIKSLFKISYPQKQLEKMLQQIKDMNTSSLINKVQQFFSSQNQMGVKLNKVLVDIQKLTKDQLNAIKQFIFLVNLNYLSVFRQPLPNKIKLQHYMTCSLIQRCQVGSYIFNKNYSIFYQNQQNDIEKVTPYKIQVQLQTNSLAQDCPQFNGYFQFKNKFIFTPYSQFLIKQIKKTQKFTTIFVEYKKNVDFLQFYFNQNICQQKDNILSVYDAQVQKEKSTLKQTFLFDSSTKQEFQKNLLRTKALWNFQKNNLQQAIKLQKQIIIRQQNNQNFDSLKLQWLNYELACFYFKAQNHFQCKRILNQILQGQPIAWLKQKIRFINNFYKQKQSQKGQNSQVNVPQPEHAFNTIVLQQTVANYSSREGNQASEDCQSQCQQEYNIFDSNDIQNQFYCLEVDKIDNFEEEFKQNVY